MSKETTTALHRRLLELKISNAECRKELLELEEEIIKLKKKKRWGFFKFRKGE